MSTNTPQIGVYSFLDVQASITGPGGSFDLASAGFSDEGITIQMSGPKNAMTIGANGDGMHSLRASRAGTVTISLLKTATGNAQLNQLYRYQEQSSAYWGRNVITVTNPVSGDVATIVGAAFNKQADLRYSTEGNMNVWAFDCIAIDEILGNGFVSTGL
jgi:hypothetical protein